MSDVVIGLIVIAATFAIYFTPTIVALARHRQVPAIAVANVLLGWTLIGWALILIWALASTAPSTRATA